MFLDQKNPITSLPDLCGSESGSDVLAGWPQPSHACSLQHCSFDDELPANPQLPPTALPHTMQCLRRRKQQEVLQFSAYFTSGKMAAARCPPYLLSALLHAGQRGAGDFHVLRSPF